MFDLQQLSVSINLMKIVSINVNSIVSQKRRDYLNDFLRSEKPDIMLICETKLSSRHRLSFDNYTLVRKDRRDSKLGGGIAVLVKNIYKFESADSRRIKNFDCLEAAGIWINMPDNERLCIFSLYASQRNSHKFASEWNLLFSELQIDNPKYYFIMAGNLNPKH